MTKPVEWTYRCPACDMPFRTEVLCRTPPIHENCKKARQPKLVLIHGGAA